MFASGRSEEDVYTYKIETGFSLYTKGTGKLFTRPLFSYKQIVENLFCWHLLS